jgi:hypothetical protein
MVVIGDLRIVQLPDTTHLILVPFGRCDNVCARVHTHSAAVCPVGLCEQRHSRVWQ